MAWMIADVTTVDVGSNLTLIALALIAAIPGIVAAFYARKASKATDETSGIAQALNGGFEARVRNANRDTAAETGTPTDRKRAEADAATAVALSAADGPPYPPVQAT